MVQNGRDDGDNDDELLAFEPAVETRPLGLNWCLWGVY